MSLSYPLLRAGRYVSWRFPRLYLPIGRLRGRVPISDWNFDLWVGGFPRSGNTYAWKALEYMQAEQRIVGHLHIPALIIRAIETGSPGLFVIRSPEDAALSWSICTALSLRHCLDYYIDFHRILGSRREQMLIARFEDIIGDLGPTIARLNRRFGLAIQAIEIDEAARESIYRKIDRLFEFGADQPSEMQVARPSEQRRDLKEQLRRELERTPYLQEKLRKANDLYQSYVSLAK